MRQEVVDRVNVHVCTYRNMKGFSWSVCTVYVWVYIDCLIVCRGFSVLYVFWSVWGCFTCNVVSSFFPASAFDGQ